MQREKINTFLVGAFNALLQLEERALSSHSEFSNLSVREYHVIEAVIACGSDNTMGAISKRLGITVGSLTVAVKTLESKGYLIRRKSDEDKRMVFVEPTETGVAANNYHTQFHLQMVDAVIDRLPQTELDALTSALGIVTDYFSSSVE